MSDTFDLHETLSQWLKNWWKIAILCVIFGLLGLGASFILKPKYEAEMVFNTAINQGQLDFANMIDQFNDPLTLSQYDVDLILDSVYRSLLQVKQSAFDYTKSLDPDLDRVDFEENVLIERHHYNWFLRFRHPDPEIAQSVVNTWAKAGLAQFDELKSSGRIAPYLSVEISALAGFPTKPIYHNRLNLTVAGAVIGFALGLLGIDFTGRYLIKKPNEMATSC
jgi:uncharacterized protein involved in exopolysaccharide biosynthesis